jgi:hypothetical protein
VSDGAAGSGAGALGGPRPPFARAGGWPRDVREPVGPATPGRRVAGRVARAAGRRGQPVPEAFRRLRGACGGPRLCYNELMTTGTVDRFQARLARKLRVAEAGYVAACIFAAAGLAWSHLGG